MIAIEFRFRPENQPRNILLHMKNTSQSLLVALVAGFTSIGAHAAPLYYVTLDSTSSTAANGSTVYEANSDPENFDIGTAFTVSSDVTVTELGIWGGAGATNNQTHTYSTVDTLPLTTTAYLWSSASTTTPLASVQIMQGANSTFASDVAGQGWAFADITPVVLTTGLTYYITNNDYTAATDSPGLGYTRIPLTNLSIGSPFTIGNGAYSSDSNFPNSNGGTPQPFGGNFIYTVATPEPSTLALCLAGLGVLALVLRRRNA
jgi:hypothetical protein